MFHTILTRDIVLQKIFNGKTYKEEWRPVVGYEEFYDVSSFGRVRSSRGGIIMRQHSNDKGYLIIGLQSPTQRKKYKVHRLVAISFNANPHNKPEVNHDDFDKTNNFYKNLLWSTGEENFEHAKRGGRIKKKDPSKQKIPVGEFPVRYQKIINTETGTIYDSAVVLSKEIGIAPKEIKRRLSGERPNNTPYKWLKGQYSLYYKKRTEAAVARYLELRPMIYGCAI